MKKRTRRMLLAVLMIITVLATDFFVLGSGIITYASQLNSDTDNPNVEFSAYFKAGENRVDSIEENIKAEDVKLYAEIKVKNEGYLKEGTVIEIENSNFNLKDEILPSNTRINSIEGNKVNLKQINNGEIIELELGIEPIIAEKISTDFLSKVSTVKMIGTYIYSRAEDGESITTEKLVSVNYQPDETLATELETEIITNKVLAVNGTDQRIVQLLIKSRLTNNEYLAKQTKLYVTIPQLSETVSEVSAIAINNTTQIENVTSQNGNTQIALNYKDENNQVNWNKNVYDEVVITYIYPEVDADRIEIKTDSEIEVYNSEKICTATETKVIENKEPNNVIIGKTEITTEELYKGQLYANLDTQYNTKTSIVITNSNVSDKIVVYEGPDTFGTAESELAVNTNYKTTEINLEKMLSILGTEGSMQIKNGETTTTINNKSTVDVNGNVVVEHKNSTAELEITTSKPVKTGILEINHTKVITGNSFTKEQLQPVKTLNTKNTILATLNGTEIVKNVTEIEILELNETISKAELTIENNKTALSTTQENEVTLGITLVTNGAQYDLYKNPKMSLKFPTAVENVELITEASKQNADEFTINVGEFDATNKTMLIQLQGEQKTYPVSELTQAYIQLNLNVTLSSLALAQTDEIMMAYTNENAVQYDGGRTDVGVVKQTVEISAPSQLIKMFNLSSNENTSFTETIIQQVKQNEAGKKLDFGISLINNKDSDISNLKILGKLPTTENIIAGQVENTLGTMLKSITAENATIYYTENSNATADINIAENAWTQDLTTLTNAKLYLIKVDTLARGTKYTATVTVQLPLARSVAENAISYSQYGVIYDTATETEVKESSRKIGLATSSVANIKTEITASVGQDILNNGDTVKEGEVIRYTVTVNNNGTSTLENVQLKLDVPEGTTYVQPLKDYIYVDGYYDEVTDDEKLAELTTITIPELSITTPYTIQYEVRVNKGTADTEISNKPIVIYEQNEVQSAELKNTISQSDIRVTIKRTVDESNQLYAGGTTSYMIYIENLSNSTINNLEMQLISNAFNVVRIENEEISLYGEEVPEKITISEIQANNMVYFSIYGLIDNGVGEMTTSSIVSDSYGKIYRSNSLKEEFPNKDAIINISSPQNGTYIKEGDIVEYNITVKNTGDMESYIGVKGAIPDILQVQSIYINGELKRQTIDSSDTETYTKTIYNDIDEGISLKANETAQFKITARVLFIPDIYHGRVITNSAKVEVLGILEDGSNIVTHILKSSEMPEDNVENVISGFAWFDANGNGRRDVEEENLPEITVKLYDISRQSYLKNEDGNDLQTITDINGEYTFTKISNGAYLVVFEYDAEKNVLTTPLVENVDTSINSKASIKTITGDRYITRVAAIEINLNRNQFGINLGLKENTGDIPIEEQPGIQEIPTEPENPTNPDEPTEPENPTNPDEPTEPENPTNPDEPTEPENPTNPDEPTEPENPTNPDEPTEPEKPEEPVDSKTISGLAWLDSNINGKKDKEETYLTGIKVRLYQVSTKDYLTDEYGKIVEVITDINGKYEFNNIEKDSYIVIFEFDTEEYKITNQNSNIVLKKINIDRQEIAVAVTDTINVQNNISNINIGLKENLKFDLELNKYISKVVVQTSKETKTYDYEEKVLGKVEIHRKQIQGSFVVLEYTIEIKNNGEIPGYAKNIVDYLPSGLTFSSELNKDWYLSGNDLFTKSLENVEINPGEEKEIKLILTKTMTNENVGLINNRAEIYQDYNKYGESDIDSTPNNQAQNEDDFGTSDVIIQVATGGSVIAYIILAIINMVLIYVAIKIMIKNEIIEIKTKEERR